MNNLATPPHQRTGNTGTVKGVGGRGASDIRHNGIVSIGSGREKTRVAKGSNPGVSVANAGNGHSNAAMAGYPHKATPGRSGKRNITSTP